ncbi:MAG: glycosyltransferase family 2 protein [Armatimonadota bacterium]
MDDKSQITLSIVIVSWNTKDLLEKCLQSIQNTVPPISHEVVVVDNDSHDGSPDMVETGFPDMKLIRAGGNLGFSAGNNIALRQVTGLYILLLNPDAELMPNAASKMIEFADTHREAAFIGPKLLNSDTTLQKNGRMFPTLLREVLGLTRLYRLIWGYYDRKMGWGREDFDVTAEVDEISGACILSRKSAVDQVGLLDERFFMYYEETDWCFRMKKAGWKIFYLPKAEVIHHWAAGAKQIGLEGSKIFHKSQYLYFKKHHGVIQANILRGLSGFLFSILRVKRWIKGSK